MMILHRVLAPLSRSLRLPELLGRLPVWAVFLIAFMMVLAGFWTSFQ